MQVTNNIVGNMNVLANCGEFAHAVVRRLVTAQIADSLQSQTLNGSVIQSIVQNRIVKRLGERGLLPTK